MMDGLLIDRLMAELAYDGGWHLVSDNPERGVRRYVSVENVSGKFRVHVKTENYAIGQVFAANARARSNTAGQRWGDGQRVASIPIDIWNRELDEAHRLGDEKYVHRWLNDSDHAKFRTFEGNL